MSNILSFSKPVPLCGLLALLKGVQQHFRPYRYCWRRSGGRRFARGGFKGRRASARITASERPRRCSGSGSTGVSQWRSAETKNGRGV